ncbi:glycosyltransferase family 4 protein [Fulvivirga sp.]|jgi:glycosyltransferase involved in cell wall biosynthesis|uniref:glycosyltransferase family 4 protein n=1 Tax=Fulvivirga sp. TaxID=1931237 RepID=UPI0032EFA6E6
MKIAIVLNTSWNVYNFRMGLIKALQEENHQVVVIAPRDEYSDKIIAQGCEFHELTMDSRGANALKDLGLVFELIKIYKRVKPDVALHYTIKPNIYGSIACRWLNIPAVNNVCGLGTVFLKKNFVSKVASWMYRVSFKYPKKVFFQNKNDKRLFIKNGLVDEKIADILPGSGIDLSRFVQSDFKRNDKFTFLLISRLIHDKGILEYIEAIRLLKAKGMDAKFQILGAKDTEHKRGIKEEIIDEWISSNTIEYLGKVEDVREFINNADCVVLPSYREGTPKSLLEAASSGKPIVTTDVPGCRDVVDHQINGLLCKMKDPEDLAKKLEIMASFNDDELKSLGLNGRKKVENQFDEKIVIKKYLNTIQELLS